MAEARHKAQTTEEGIHTPIAFEYANAAERLAAGPFEAFDKNKYALQLDTGSIYRLAVPASSTWVAAAGSPVISQDLDMDGYDILDVGLVDGVDISSHSGRHEAGGLDEIDGYNIALIYNPVNYNAPVSDVLGEHIAAIDVALAGSGGIVGGDLSGTLPNPSVIDLTITGEEQGSVIYFDGFNWSALNTGIDGYVLTTHGDGSNPTWEEASGGAFTPDGKVLVTITDGVSGYLEDKIEPGTGLTTEVLHDLTGVPLVRYYFDEAASGTTSTEVLDYAASPYDLPISYGDNLSYVEDTGRGIVGVATTNEGFVGVPSFAGKLANINGGNTATFEFVVKSTTTAWGFLGVYGSDARRIEISHINSQISILIEDVGNFIATFTNGTTRTYHIVIDSTQPGVDDKVKMYVDGVQVAVTIGFAPMPLNYTFNVAGKFGYMSRGDGDLDFQGTLYYAAIYEDVLTESQIIANHTVLSANNDHPTLENQKLKLSVGGFTGEEQGAVLYNNGTDWVALPTGTDGYVLTTHGDGSNPTWSFVEGGSTDISSVANLTALDILSDTSQLVWVETLSCFWKKNETSVLTPDGITIIAASGGGNWERIVSSTSYKWLSQGSWTIDPVLGSDENDGSISPIETFSELTRRLSVGSIQQDTVITIPEGADIANAELIINVGRLYSISIIGTTTVSDGYTLSAYSARVHTGTPIGTHIEATEISDWTSFVGKRIRMTSGTGSVPGSLSWVGKVNPGGVGVDVARIGLFSSISEVSYSTTTQTPAVSNTFVFEELPWIRRFKLIVNGEVNAELAFRVKIRDLNLGNRQILSANIDSNIVIDGCGVGEVGSGEIGQLHFGLTLPNLKGILARSSIQRANDVRVSGAACIIDAKHLVTLTLLDVNPTPYQWSFSTALIQGVVSIQAAYVTFGDTQFMDTGGSAIQAFGPVSYIESTSSLSGTGNTIGVLVGVGAGQTGNIIFAWRSTLPNLLGSTTDIRISGSTNIDRAWSQMPYRNDEQKGVATLVSGTATVTARGSNTRGVVISRATAIGTLGPILEAPTASRSATQFVINAKDTAGAVVTTDVSTVDWHIPGTARPVVFCQLNSLNAPV